ncbi:MAG: transporter [Ignavibacteria bacterium]|nr:transporter [Ignavibacteria bacterium]
MKRLLLLSMISAGIFSHSLRAETPGDGLMMSKNSFCQVLSYSQNSWSQYWESDVKRSNSNLGTFRSHILTLMGAYGLTDDLNVIYSLPYVTTGFSDSYLSGYQGFQDVSLWLKYNAYTTETSLGTLAFFGTVGGSIPTHNYVVNQLPASIGMGTWSGSLRAVADFTTKDGWYGTFQAGYTVRGESDIDEESYFFNGRLYNTNSIPIPNAADFTLRLGHITSDYQVDAYFDRFTCVSGDDIRYNSMPTPTVMMQSSTIGLYGRYNIGMLSIMANASQVVAGRNFGQSTMLNIGFGYIFQFGGGDEEMTHDNEPKLR